MTNLSIPYFSQRENKFNWQERIAPYRIEKNAEEEEIKIPNKDSGQLKGHGRKKELCYVSCNVTCLAMLLHYLGLTRDSPDMIMDKICNWDCYRDLHNEMVSVFPKDHSIAYRLFESPHNLLTIAKELYHAEGASRILDHYSQVKEAVADGYPVVVNCGINEFSEAHGHYVVVRGFTDDKVIINDPWGCAADSEGNIPEYTNGNKGQYYLHNGENVYIKESEFIATLEPGGKLYGAFVIKALRWHFPFVNYLEDSRGRKTPDLSAYNCYNYDLGGYPLKRNNQWHSGVHLCPPGEGDIVSPLGPGTLVAARVVDRDPPPNGSRCFFLMKHTLPDNGSSFFSLYMHIMPWNQSFTGHHVMKHIEKLLSSDPKECTFLKNIPENPVYWHELLLKSCSRRARVNADSLTVYSSWAHIDYLPENSEIDISEITVHKRSGKKIVYYSYDLFSDEKGPVLCHSWLDDSIDEDSRLNLSPDGKTATVTGKKNRIFIKAYQKLGRLKRGDTVEAAQVGKRSNPDEKRVFFRYTYRGREILCWAFVNKYSNDRQIEHNFEVVPEAAEVLQSVSEGKIFYPSDTGEDLELSVRHGLGPAGSYFPEGGSRKKLFHMECFSDTCLIPDSESGWNKLPDTPDNQAFLDTTELTAFLKKHKVIEADSGLFKYLEDGVLLPEELDDLYADKEAVQGLSRLICTHESEWSQDLLKVYSDSTQLRGVAGQDWYEGLLDLFNINHESSEDKLQQYLDDCVVPYLWWNDEVTDHLGCKSGGNISKKKAVYYHPFALYEWLVQRELTGLAGCGRYN